MVLGSSQVVDLVCRFSDRRGRVLGSSRVRNLKFFLRDSLLKKFLEPEDL